MKRVDGFVIIRSLLLGLAFRFGLVFGFDANDLATFVYELDAIATHLDAVRNEYRDMKREVHDLRVLLDMTDDDDIDP